MKTKISPVIVREILCLKGIIIMDYDWYVYTLDEPEPINVDVVDVHELYTLYGVEKSTKQLELF